MIGSPWKARNLRASAFLRMTLFMLLLLYGLSSLRSGSNRAVAHSPRTFLISAPATLSIHGPTEAPRTPSSPGRQSRGPMYSAEIHGVITSVTIAYLRRVLQLAEAANADVLIIQMSPTGGVLRDVRSFAGDGRDERHGRIRPQEVIEAFQLITPPNKQRIGRIGHSEGWSRRTRIGCEDGDGFGALDVGTASGVDVVLRPERLGNRPSRLVDVAL